MKSDILIFTFLLFIHRFRTLEADESELKNQLLTTRIASQSNRTNPHKSRLSIVEYMNAHTNISPHHFILLKWDKHGNLELQRMKTIIRESYMDHWFDPNAQDCFSAIQAKASRHGTVALLLNSDHVASINWNLQPPVPMLTYTAPIHHHVVNELTTNVWIIPNPYDRGGYSRWCVSKVQKVAPDFATRKNKVVWRGSIHSRDIERSRVILLEEVAVDEKDASHWLDAKNSSDQNFENAHQLSMENMVEYKYQLDVGGLSGTSWGGLRWKMCSGSLVMKVDTWSKDWWHDKIRPWKEFVPVKDDLSDLYAMWQWAEDNPEEAAAIAIAGRKACDISVTEGFVNHSLENTIMSLPQATGKHVKEANAILDDSSTAL